VYKTLGETKTAL